MELVLVALGAMKATELFKELLPWPPAAWVRSLVSLTFTALLASLVVGPGKHRALLCVGAWGLAALLHEVASLLAKASDNFKLEIMTKAVGRRR